MIFADKLILLRKKAGWSQEELADQMNVTRQSVSKWEGAQSVPDLENSPTVIIAPITSRVHTKAKIPTHTLIKDFDGLDKNSIILFEQIRTIDKQRLREYLGTLDRRFIHCADKALAISIGLAKKD